MDSLLPYFGLYICCITSHPKTQSLCNINHFICLQILWVKNSFKSLLADVSTPRGTNQGNLIVFIWWMSWFGELRMASLTNMTSWQEGTEARLSWDWQLKVSQMVFLVLWSQVTSSSEAQDSHRMCRKRLGQKLPDFFWFSFISPRTLLPLCFINQTNHKFKPVFEA